jgi:hypothetical protein
MVRGMMDDLDGELPVLSFNGPGHYRLRVHARGRDTAVDLSPDEITEWYLIQAWPAAARGGGYCARPMAMGRRSAHAERHPLAAGRTSAPRGEQRPTNRTSPTGYSSGREFVSRVGRRGSA